MVEPQSSKLITRVRFPSAPPKLRRSAAGRAAELFWCCESNPWVGPHREMLRATRSDVGRRGGDDSHPPLRTSVSVGVEGARPVTGLGGGGFDLEHGCGRGPVARAQVGCGEGAL